MVTYEEAQDMLGEIIDEFPQELFNGLSGGTILAEEEKLHPKSQPSRPLYVMGEYHVDCTGKYIIIYYGSFRAVCGYYKKEDFRRRLRHTFKHELRHHIERLSGITTLNKYDDDRMELYDSGMDISGFDEPPVC